MSFGTQTIEGLLEARGTASKFMVEEGLRARPMSIEDAFILQAVSHVLASEPDCYGLQIAAATELYHTTVYRRLRAFEHQDRLLDSSNGKDRSRYPRDARRRLYRPTDTGRIVLDYFQMYC